jgi:Integrase zinc binding domain
MEALMAVCMVVSMELDKAAGGLAAGSRVLQGPRVLSTPTPPLSTAELQRLYPKGYAMLASKGWKAGMPLGGTSSTALLTPVWGHRVDGADKAGLGYHGPPAAVGECVTAALADLSLGGPRVCRPSAFVAATEESLTGAVADVLSSWEPVAVPIEGSAQVEVLQGSLVCQLAVEQEQGLAGGGSRDVWLDADAMHYLREGSCQLWWSPAKRRALARRVSPYVWAGGQLHRVLADGSRRVVPPPEAREQLVRDTHAQCGHFGEKRTVSLLQANHWWYGLYRDVYEVVRACEVCRRVNATFNAQPQQLSPLPMIQGLFFRW